MLPPRPLAGGKLPLVKLPLRWWCRGPDGPGCTPDMFDTALRERAARDGKSNTAGSSPASAEKLSAGLKLVQPMSAPRAAGCTAGLMAIGSDLAWFRLLVKVGLARGLTGEPACEEADLPANRKLPLPELEDDSRLTRNDSLLWSACAGGSAARGGCSPACMLLPCWPERVSGSCGPEGTWAAACPGAPVLPCRPCCTSAEQLPVCAACCWQADLTWCQRARGLAADWSGNKLPAASSTAQGSSTGTGRHQTHRSLSSDIQRWATLTRSCCQLCI